MAGPNNQPQSALYKDAREILLKVFRPAKIYAGHHVEYADHLSENCLLAKIHQSLLNAFANTNLLPIYKQLWILLESKLVSVEWITDLAQLEHSFDRIDLPNTNQKLFSAIIYFYKAIAVFCCALHQIATIGNETNVLMDKIQLNNFKKSDVLSKEEKEGLSIKQRLIHATQTLQSDVDLVIQNGVLVSENNLIADAASDNSLGLQIYYFLQSYSRQLDHNISEFEQEDLAAYQLNSDRFKTLQTEYDELVEDIKKYRENLHQLKTNYTKNIADLREKIKNTESRLKAVSKRNIEENQDFLEDEALELIQQHTDGASKLKSEILEQQAEVNKRAQCLHDKRLELDTLYKDIKQGNFTRPNLQQVTVTPGCIMRRLAAPPKGLNVDYLTTVKQADALCNDVSSLIDCALSAMKLEVESQDEINKFCKSIYREKCLKLYRILREYYKSSALIKVNSARKSSARQLSIELDHQAPNLIKGLFNEEAKNIKNLWQEAINAVQEVGGKNIDDIMKRILNKFNDKMSLAQSEMTVLEAELQAENKNHEFSQKKLQKNVDELNKLKNTYNQIRTDIFNASLARMKMYYDIAQQDLVRVRNNLTPDFDSLQAEAMKYIPPIKTTPKVDANVILEKEFIFTENQIKELRHIHAKKMHLLKGRLEVKTRNERIAQVDAICANTKPSQQPRQKNFFARHWGKIVMATTTGLTLGGGVGFAFGSFTLLPTVGLGTIALTAIGGAIGLAVGFVAGVVGAAISDCCYSSSAQSHTLSANTTNIIHEGLQSKPTVKSTYEVRDIVVNQNNRIPSTGDLWQKQKRMKIASSPHITTESKQTISL